VGKPGFLRLPLPDPWGTMATLAGAGATIGALVISYFIWIAPQDFTPDLQKQFAALIHDIHRDKQPSQDGPARVAAFIHDNRLRRTSVEIAERELDTRIALATQSISRGKLLIERRAYEQARVEFRSATQSDPEDPLAWASLGGADMVLGWQGEAREAYERSLELDPLNWLAHYNLGCYFVRAGNTGSALEQLERAMALLPSPPPLRKQVCNDLKSNGVWTAVRQDPRFQALFKPSRECHPE